MMLTQSYEPQRDLLISMAHHRGSTLVTQREYSYDVLGRPTARNTSRQGNVVNDTFAHNNRSELTAATVNGVDYEYAYDNIGNRQQATEGNDVTVYDANALNQYTAISENGASAFVPQFDADGNQTLIKTETGIWTVVYNAENRPVTFTNSDSNTVVECQYDSMGRRAYKKVTVNGEVTLHQRYIYCGYLQIVCIDLTRSNHPALWFITWDPTQPVATRPLAIRKDGSWFTYGWDLTKNICELYGPAGYPRTTYTYSPFGEVSASGDLSQPIQWSSEMWDSELGLVYYNWRYYNTASGGWSCRDRAGSLNLYKGIHNNGLIFIDFVGNSIFGTIAITVIGVSAFAGGFYLGRYIRKRIAQSKGEISIYAPNYFAHDDEESKMADWRTGVLFYNKIVEYAEDIEIVIKETQKNSGSNCISKLLLAAHGQYKQATKEAIMSVGYESLTESDTLFNISSLFKNVHFCSSCILEIRSCQIGKSKQLYNRLKKYGCLVILYDYNVSPVM